MKEPETETQETELALPGQKRKRALSDTSEDESSEDEDDAEAVAIAFQKAEHPISGASPNGEAINEVVNDEDDFISSKAPSLSSIGAGVDTDVVAAPQKAGSFLSLHGEEEEDNEEEMLYLRLEEVQLKRRLREVQRRNHRSSSSIS